MNTQLIKESLAAIQSCDTKKNIYLRVVGTKDNQKLVTEIKTWFGRLLMCLGISSCSMRKITDFIEKNVKPLWDQAIIENKTTAFLEITKKISRFNDKHSKKIQNAVNSINKIAVLPAKETAKKEATPSKDPIKEPVKNPIEKKPEDNKNLQAKARVSLALKADDFRHQETNNVIKTIKVAIEKKNSLNIPKAKTPEKPPQTKNEPSSPTVTVTHKNTPEEEALIDAFVGEFKDKRKDSEDVDHLLRRLVTPSQSTVLKKPHKHPNKGNEEQPQPPKEVERFPIPEDMVAFVAIIHEMTPEEVATYAAAESDVFKIKEGPVYRPSLTFAAASAAMNEQQLKALINALYKAFDSNLPTLQDALNKLFTFVPNNKRIIDEIIAQPKFYEAIFEQPSRPYDENWGFDEKKNFELEIWIQLRLAESYLVYLLRNQNVPQREQRMSDCFLLSRENICKKARKILTAAEQVNLAEFIVKNFDPDDWNKEDFMKKMLESPKNLERLIQSAKPECKEYLGKLIKT